MDLFIDKLAQKLSSTEMIKANSAPDNREIEELKAKIGEYEKLLQEMKLINLKNIESAEKINSIAAACASAAEEADNAAKAANQAVADIAEARMNEENDEENDELLEKTADDILEKTSDVIHRENVKVYRNIQASLKSSLEDQTKVIVDSQEETARKNSNTFLKVMSVLIFVAVLADIALKVITILGIL